MKFFLKPALPKVTGVLTLLFAFVWIDQSLYYKSPWGGGGFIDLEPMIVAVAFHASLLFFVITLALIFFRKKRVGVAVPGGYKAFVKRTLPLISGTVAVCGLLRFICFTQSVTYYYLTGFYVSMVPSRFLGLTIKQHFIVHCAITIVCLVLTLVLTILQNKTARDSSAASR